MSGPSVVRTLRTRGTVLASLLGAQAIWSAASISATLHELDLFERVNVGTGVVWLLWQHHGQHNLQRLGVRDLAFSPSWAVGWWFWAGERTWAVLGWWWGLLVASEVLGRIAVVRAVVGRQEEKIRVGLIVPPRPDTKEGLPG
jgi:hypothetical protein